MAREVYFASIPPSGSAEFFIELFMGRNTRKNFLGPCKVEILEIGNSRTHGSLCHASYVQEIMDYFGCGFRNVDWKNNLEYFSSVLKKYPHKDIWFATFLPETVDIIKKNFSPEVITLAINYSPEDFNMVCQQWAKWQGARIFYNNKFIKLRKKFNAVSDAIEYCYKTGPEQFGFSIPRSLQVDADIMINLVDIFDEHKLKKILDTLGFECTEQDWNFYREYIKIPDYLMLG